MASMGAGRNSFPMHPFGHWKQPKRQLRRLRGRSAVETARQDPRGRPRLPKWRSLTSSMSPFNPLRAPTHDSENVYDLHLMGRHRKNYFFVHRGEGETQVFRPSGTLNSRYFFRGVKCAGKDKPNTLNKKKTPPLGGWWW